MLTPVHVVGKKQPWAHTRNLETNTYPTQILSYSLTHSPTPFLPEFSSEDGHDSVYSAVCSVSRKLAGGRYIPGLNVIRQDLLVHVPSGNIIICNNKAVNIQAFSLLFGTSVTSYNKETCIFPHNLWTFI